MLSTNRMALKEWACVCRALSQGRQRILFRKGGIAEGPSGFQVEHPEFWLFPTQFHQSSEQLRPEVRSDFATLTPPSPGTVVLDTYAVVINVEFCEDLFAVRSRIPEQVLSEATVVDRFHYKRPGLYVITVQAHVLPCPHIILDRPEYAGCHSWVPLTEELSTAGILPSPC